MQNQRVLWIDYAKVLGIFLVILGHSPLYATPINVIYAFHMPLFFFVSGHLFQREKYKGIKDFLAKKWRQLILPYFLLNIILYIIWLVKSIVISDTFDAYQMVGVPLFSILYGTAAIDGFLLHCIAIWFISCLFIVELLFFIPFINKVLLTLLCLVLAFADYKFSFFILPWGINIALTAIGFFWLGNSFRNAGVMIRWTNAKRLERLAILTFLALVFGAVIYFNGRVDMGSRHYANYLLFLIGGVTGTLIFIALAWSLSLVLKRNYWVEHLSNNTIVILAFHGLFISAFGIMLQKIISVFVLKVDAGNFGLNFFIGVLVMVCMIPVIYGMKRFLPVAVGKTVQQKTPKKLVHEVH